MSDLHKDEKWLSVGFTNCIQQQPGPMFIKKDDEPLLNLTIAVQSRTNP
jgi:hypothetical protein